jgi:prepilin-type N-terminal cleavage/methylation domain-containing protein
MHPPSSHRKAFTLIELLVVIAIIAILSVVVILTLNPAELLRQARDSSRVSDVATLTNALNVYLADQGTAASFSLGNSSGTYPSVYDPTATSTAGDQCQGLTMVSLNSSSGQFWQCSGSNYQRLVNGTGWIPVILSNISSGAPIGNLPVDPTNQTSTGLIYTYNANGTQFEVTASLESQKYKTQYASNLQTAYFPEVISGGTPTISSLYNPTGLVGYWNFDESSGSSTIDRSGNGNIGTWAGTAIGTNGTYYAGGKVGSGSGIFDGATTWVGMPSSTSLQVTNVTVSAWVNVSSASFASIHFIDGFGNTGVVGYWIAVNSPNKFEGSVGNGTTESQLASTGSLSPNTWSYVAMTFDGTTQTLYINGVVDSTSTSVSGNLAGYGTLSGAGSGFDIGNIVGLSGTRYLSGQVDDVRVYNRALSPAEIKALYNTEK